MRVLSVVLNKSERATQAHPLISAMLQLQLIRTHSWPLWHILQLLEGGTVLTPHLSDPRSSLRLHISGLFVISQRLPQTLSIALAQTLTSPKRQQRQQQWPLLGHKLIKEGKLTTRQRWIGVKLRNAYRSSVIPLCVRWGCSFHLSCLSDWIVSGWSYTSSLTSLCPIRNSLWRFNLPKLVISQKISLMCTTSQLCSYTGAIKKSSVHHRCHYRNWCNIYSGHVSPSDCPEKMRPSLIFSSSPVELLYLLWLWSSKTQMFDVQRKSRRRV